jgi:glycosyltransferase involved in cell wall biosynthesis
MLFSIITINYNNSEGLRQTIDSVVSQTYHEYEYIIIDGGSTDGSVNIIKSFSDHIDYWVSEKDRGIYHAMNKGVAQAHGDYCIFMNSGDLFYNNSVLKLVEESKIRDDIVVGKVVINSKDKLISPPPTSGELTLYHLYSGAIPHQGTFIKTELLRKYPYDENLKISSDWKFFVQVLIIDNRSIHYIDSYVARYDTDGISASNPVLMRKEKDDVLADLFPPRVLADYKQMKQSECMTQTLTPQLRMYYSIDKLVYNIGRMLLKIRHILS